MGKQPCVSILSGGQCGYLCTGVTFDLIGRLHQHRTGTTRGWAHEKGAHYLVWYELHGSIASAITREKRIKH